MYPSYLKAAIERTTFLHEFKNILNYAVFPPGKLFRPRLVQCLASDLNLSNKDFLHLGTAIELHHAYSLVHDDLPSMDNDLERRGKPSTHAAFGEWKAILAGDSLLIESFQEVAKISSINPIPILKLFFWASSGKGLIAGQFLDLSAKKNKTLEEISRIHELKTSRLIQVATIGTYLLSTTQASMRSLVDFMRLGKEIGISFQFLDDLGELTATELSSHEDDINPFLSLTDEAFSELSASICRLKAMTSKLKLDQVENMLKDYFSNNKKMFLENTKEIEKHLGENLNKNSFENLISILEHF